MRPGSIDLPRRQKWRVSSPHRSVWQLESPTGRVWADLPSQRSAMELACSLASIDHMLNSIARPRLSAVR